MNKPYFILFFFVFYFSDTFLLAQADARFERIARAEGLSHNNVQAVIQDKYGFMWFGTQDGLDRYDGFVFKHYYNEPSNLNSVLSNNISAICQASDGKIWFGTYYNGLDCYDPLLNKFTHYFYDEDNPVGLPGNDIRDIKEDREGNIWIATFGGGLSFYSPKLNRFTTYSHQSKNKNSLSSNDVHVICFDNKNNLWIGTATNLDHFDINKGVFTHYVIGFESFDESRQLAVKTLFYDSQNMLWIGSSDGLYTYNAERKIFKQYRHYISDHSSISDDNINAIFVDSYNNIWIGTANGLNRYLPDTDGFEAFLVNDLDRSSISNNNITCLFEDRANILWIGTKGGGINKLDLKRKRFNAIKYTPNMQGGLTNPNVTALYGDDSGNIWIGTDGGGVCIFDKNNNTLKMPRQYLSPGNFLSDDQVVAAVYGKNKTWFGMLTGGLNSVELINGKYQVQKFSKNKDSTGISNNQVNCLMYDKEGFLWIGTRDGLNKLIDTVKNGNEYFISYTKNYSDRNSLTGNDISCLYQDHKGFIWVGTRSAGLNRINTATGKIDQFQSEIDNPATIGSNRINTIFEDHFGIIWIGTGGGGLNKLNSDNQTFTRIMIRDGLASNEVMAILEDYLGYIWISTSKGLSKYDPVNSFFTNFDITDGLLSDGFNPSAAYQDESGCMFFGTNSGLIYFHPSEIMLNQYKPDIIVTRFLLMKQNEWKDSDIFISKYNSEENKIVLNYDKNLFSLEFAAMDYTNPLKNSFQYKIVGLNDNWIDYGNKRSLMVTNLEPGSYVLKIRGTNNDGIFNEEGISLSIIVRPPFWKSNWFYILFFLFLAGIAIAIYSYLVKMKTNKILASKNRELELTNQRLSDSERSLKELNHTKDKFFSIIAHDLRNPFNPLLALTELLDNDYSDLSEKERIGFIKEIRHGAKKLYDLLENLLNWALSQTKQIKFNPVQIELNDIIENNIELLGINAEKKGISVKAGYNDKALVMADENMLNSIIRNLLNNAIKFSPEKSEINISIQESENHFTVEVRDQGPGIPLGNSKDIFKAFSSQSIQNSKGKGSGLGLILCKEFVETNGGNLWVQSEEGKGSSFFFTLIKASGEG